MNAYPLSHSLACCVLVCIALFAFTPSAFAQAVSTPADVRGTWLGTLTVPGAELRIVFNISGTADSLTATLDSPDQGATGIPASSVTLDGDSLEVQVASVMGTFRGKVGAEGEQIEGTWAQGGQAFPLVVERTEEAPAPKEQPKRPQEPEEPFPYQAEDVTFVNEADGVELAGTLTLPDSERPHPAVALITGSGPQDRDETVAGHRPFLVLADHLTRQGIAVLRYDDRGFGESTGDFAQATSEDFARDALAATAYLKTRPEIDAGKIGLLGHSEGGLIAPIAATQSADVAFLVLLAPPGVTGEEILYAQGALIAKAEGTSDSTVQNNQVQQERLFAALRQTTDSAQAATDVRRVLEESGLPADAVEAQTQQITSPWFRYFLTHDPAPVLAQVEVPVLALFGENDLQVPAETNRAAVEAALESGGNAAYTAKVLPGLNHLFQTSETGAVSQYSQIEETMAVAVLEKVAGWIQEQTEESGR